MKRDSISTILALAATIALCVSPLGLRGERVLIDSIVVPALQHEARDDILLVALDDVSLDVLSEEEGFRWPFPRSVHAQVVRNLRAAGAKAVFLDFIFDLNSSFGEEDDEELEDAVGEGEVFLAAEDSEQAHTLPRSGFVRAGAIPVNASLPLDIDGFIREAPDGEGLARDASSVLQYLFLGRTRERQVRSEIRPVSEALRRVDSPAAKGVSGFVGTAGAVPRVSYFEVFSPELVQRHEAQIRGRVVLVGSTPSVSADPSGKSDVYLTSVGPLPGVEIHANLLGAQLRGALAQPLSGGAVPLLLVALTFVLTQCYRRFSQPMYSFLFACSASGLWVGVVFLAAKSGVLLPCIFPLSLSAALFFTRLAVNYLEERDQRLITRAQLFNYLPARVAEHVLKNPQGLAGAQDRKRITILFADLAGFTTLSEKESPESIITILQSHLQDMTEILFANDGTLDKYLGDGIMAFWGAPEEQENHADLALNAAIQMFEKFDAGNKEREARGEPRLSLRIGLHTGDAIVGNVGSSLFLDYTAIGDAVNTAARLEGANKLFGTRLLLSEATVASLTVKPAKPLFAVGRVQVKGKGQALAVSSVSEAQEEEGFRKLQEILSLLDERRVEDAIQSIEHLSTTLSEFAPIRFYHSMLKTFGAPEVDAEGRCYWQMDGK